MTAQFVKRAFGKPGSSPSSTLLLASALLFSLLLPIRGLALDPTKSVFHFNCRSWTRQNGLPANGVNAITQTKDGYLWLGTARGLVRFDGSEFKLVELGHLPHLRSTIVTSLSSSRRGGLWFSLERSAFAYCDGNGVSFRGKEEWGGLNQNVHSLLETGDAELWIAAESKSGRLANALAYETPPGLDGCDVTALYQDSQGRVWLGTTRHGLYCWQNGILTPFPDRSLNERIIRSVVEDKDGQIWVGTEMGVLCYDAHAQRKPLPFPWYETRALLVDRQGAVWAGTTSGGVVRYVDGVPTSLHKTDGLADDFATALAEDQEGSIWIGTRNGLTQLSDVKFPTFGKNEGLTANVNISVCASRLGGLWVATSEGFTYFDGKARPYPADDVGLTNHYIKGILEARNGDLYLINGASEIEVVSGGKVVARYPTTNWATALAEDDQGVLVTVGGDLYRVSANCFAPYTFTNGQKPSLNWVFNMAVSHDGALWLSSSDGLCRVKDGAFTLWTKEDGLGDSKVLWVCEDTDGVVWAGLETGMARLKDGQIQNISRDNGLFDNIVYTIVPDDHGSLWVNSGRGLFRVSRQKLNDFAERKTDYVECMGYDSLEAVKSVERNQQDQSGCKTLDGRIWFPTAQGVVRIDPADLTASPIPPKVHIQNVRANGKALDQAAKAIVRPGRGELEFYYAGLSYISPEKIHYRYKLDGYDKDWVQAGTRRSAFYTNLKPGDYHFGVEACDADGAWNPDGANFVVRMLPHYYQSAWLKAVAGFLATGGLFGLIGWRVRHLKCKQRSLQQAHDLLEAKVKERTAELAESNSFLQNQIEERKWLQLEAERIHRQLVAASRQAGQAEVASSVLHNVGNVLNSVNVSATLLTDCVKKSKAGNLGRAADLLQEHAADLGAFLTADLKGRQLPAYLSQLARHLAHEQAKQLEELELLRQRIDHIKDIVAMQQSYAKVCGVSETVKLTDLVQDALSMNAGALERHQIQLVREYHPHIPDITVEKHKVLQILVNLIRNAKHACDESGRTDKRLTLRVANGEGRVKVSVIDNGVGIPAETLTRIFNHGFTTRKDGHGFGLHSGALVAKEMGGTLLVHSDGQGRGATFTLELPLSQKA